MFTMQIGFFSMQSCWVYIETALSDQEFLSDARRERRGCKFLHLHHLSGESHLEEKAWTARSNLHTHVHYPGRLHTHWHGFTLNFGLNFLTFLCYQTVINCQRTLSFIFILFVYCIGDYHHYCWIWTDFPVVIVVGINICVFTSYTNLPRSLSRIRVLWSS